MQHDALADGGGLAVEPFDSNGEPSGGIHVPIRTMRTEEKRITLRASLHKEVRTFFG